MEFEEYVAARGRALERYAYLLTGDLHRSQDLVQTALVEALVRWRRISRVDHPDAYVRRIVTTRHLDWHRRVAGSLNATTPLFTLGLAMALQQEQRTAGARLVGLTVGFVGALVVLAPWQESGALGSRTGQLACLLAAACYAVSYVYIGRFIAGSGLPSLVLSASQLSAGALMLLVTAPLYAGEPVQLTLPVVTSILALGLLGTGAAYILNYRLITDEGPTTASVVSYFLPIVAVILGVLVLDEPLTWNLAAGAALVLLGVAIAQGRLGMPRRGAQAAYSRSPGERER